MEYRYLKFKEESTDKLCCEVCLHTHHSVIGSVKYGFMFLELLPFFPIKRKVTVACKSCKKIYNDKLINPVIYKEFKKSIFKFYRILPMYSGAIITLLMLFYWQWGLYQSELNTQKYIQTPKVNDFYYFNQRQLSGSLHPNEKYSLAKVVSINDGMVSLVFGIFRFKRESSIEKDIRSGMVLDSRYFNKQRYLFSGKKLLDLYDEQTVISVKRPIYNRLFGNVVISNPPANVQMIRGGRENERGLAFLQHSSIKSNVDNAYKYFLKSAVIGYSEGQLNLARLYISSGKTNKALHWLKKSALQGNSRATELYWKNCKLESGCDVSVFKKKLKVAGFQVL